MNDNRKTHCSWPAWSENKLFTVLLGILMVYGIIWIGARIRNDIKQFQYIGKNPGADIINIEGEGIVKATPTIATVDIGVMTEKPEVATAQTENTTKMNAILKEIKGLGVDSKDIKTTNFTVNPLYDFPKGVQTLRGYQVTQSVQVKIRDLQKTGTILTMATGKGANQVSGVSFTIDDPENLKAEARTKALDSAVIKAQSIAKRLGVRLGRVVMYNEYSANPGPTPMYAMAKEGMGGENPPTPSIEAGTNEVRVNVNIGFEIL